MTKRLVAALTLTVSVLSFTVAASQNECNHVVPNRLNSDTSRWWDPQIYMGCFTVDQLSGSRSIYPNNGPVHSHRLQINDDGNVVRSHYTTSCTEGAYRSRRTVIWAHQIISSVSDGVNCEVQEDDVRRPLLNVCRNKTREFCNADSHQVITLHYEESDEDCSGDALYFRKRTVTDCTGPSLLTECNHAVGTVTRSDGSTFVRTWYLGLFTKTVDGDENGYLYYMRFGQLLRKAKEHGVLNYHDSEVVVDADDIIRTVEDGVNCFVVREGYASASAETPQVMWKEPLGHCGVFQHPSTDHVNGRIFEYCDIDENKLVSVGFAEDDDRCTRDYIFVEEKVLDSSVYDPVSDLVVKVTQCNWSPIRAHKVWEVENEIHSDHGPVIQSNMYSNGQCEDEPVHRRTTRQDLCQPVYSTDGEHSVSHYVKHFCKAQHLQQFYYSASDSECQHVTAVVTHAISVSQCQLWTPNWGVDTIASSSSNTCSQMQDETEVSFDDKWIHFELFKDNSCQVKQSDLYQIMHEADLPFQVTSDTCTCLSNVENCFHSESFSLYMKIVSCHDTEETISLMTFADDTFDDETQTNNIKWIGLAAGFVVAIGVIITTIWFLKTKNQSSDRDELGTWSSDSESK